MNVPMLAVWLIVGLLSGAAFFASLRWLAQRLLACGTACTPWLRLALVQLLRLALLGALLFVAARAGAPALLACATGVLAARMALTTLLGRLPPEAPQ